MPAMTNEDWDEILGTTDSSVLNREMLPSQETENMQSLGTIVPSQEPTPISEQREDAGIIGTVFDVVKGVVSSPLKEIENVAQAARDVADYVDNKFLGDRYVRNDVNVNLVPDFATPDTKLGQTAQDLSAYALGWITAGKLVTAPIKGMSAMTKLAKAAPRISKLAGAAATGVTMDFINADGTEENFTRTLINNDLIGGPVAELMATDENDPRAINRLKHALEGVPLGIAVDIVTDVISAAWKGWKAAKRGDLDAAILARKEAAEKLGQEGAEALPKNVDEQVAQLYDTMKERAKPDFDKLTPEAQRLYSRKAVAEDPKAWVESTKKFFNTTNLQDKQLRDLIDSYQPELDDKVIKNVPFLLKMHLDGVEYVVANNADKVFNKDLFLSTGGLKDVAPEYATARRFAAMDYVLPKQFEIAAQLMKENGEEGVQKARELAEATLEIVTDQKSANLTANHTLNASRANSWWSKTQGRYSKKGPQGQELAENAMALPKELVASKSDKEIQDYVDAVVTNMRRGEGPQQLMKLTALLTEAKSPLRQAMQIPDNKVLNSAMRFRYFSMLSSFKTPLRAAIGNAGMVPLLAFEEEIKSTFQGALQGFADNGVIGAVKGAFTGAKEGIYFQKGLLIGMKQARENFFNAIRYGEALSRPNPIAKELAERQEVYGIMKNKLFDYPTRLLLASDEFFGTMLGTAKAYQDAMLTLKRSGYLEKIPKEYREEVAQKWLADYMQNAFMDVTLDNGKVLHTAFALSDSKRIADEGTFQQALDGAFKKMQRFVNANTATRILFPFVKSPTNITKAWLWTRNPVVQAFRLSKIMKSGSPEEIAQVMTNLTSGLILWTTAFNLAAAGKITGEGPENRAQNNMLRETGWRPGSYRSENGTYVSLNALEPFGSILSLMATYYERAQREDLSWLDLSNIGHALKVAVVDKTYLKGLSDLMLAIDREQSGMYLVNIGTSFVPGILRDFGMVVDPVQRAYGTDFYSRALGRTPFKSQLAPQYAWLTGLPKIYSDGTGLGPMFDALTSTKEKNDAVFYELSRLENGLTEPNRKLGSRKLTDHEYAAYCAIIGTIKLGGRTLYETLSALINSPEYQADVRAYPDPDDFTVAKRREERITDIIKQYQEAGRIQFLREYPNVARESGYQKWVNF